MRTPPGSRVLGAPAIGEDLVPLPTGGRSWGVSSPWSERRSSSGRRRPTRLGYVAVSARAMGPPYAEQVCPLDAGVGHDGSEVFDALVHGRHARRAVRGSRTPLVEVEDPSERPRRSSIVRCGAPARKPLVNLDDRDQLCRRRSAGRRSTPRVCPPTTRTGALRPPSRGHGMGAAAIPRSRLRHRQGHRVAALERDGVGVQVISGRAICRARTATRPVGRFAAGRRRERAGSDSLLA